MSMMLGPIHYRMFDKSRAVDAFARDLAAHSDEQGWTDGLAAATDAEAPRLEGTLEDHVDVAAIHASLNGLVARSEGVLASVCVHLSGHQTEVEAYARAKGREAGAAADLSQASPQEVWDAIDLHWLDGMPCDGFMRFTDNNPDCVAWAVDYGPHAAQGYAGMREAWTRGFAEGAGISLRIEDGSFEVRRAA